MSTDSHSTPQNAKRAFDPELLHILVCPLTRSPLKMECDELVATIGGLRYPIRDGVPILLIEQAKLPDGVASIEEFRKKFAQQISQLSVDNNGGSSHATSVNIGDLPH